MAKGWNWGYLGIGALALSAGRAAAQSAWVEPQLRNWIQHVAPDKSVDVVVYGTYQPAPPISRAVERRYAQSLERVTSQIRGIARLLLPGVSMDPVTERQYFGKPLAPRFEGTLLRLQSDLDGIRTQIIREIVQQTNPLVERRQRQIIARIESLGGSVVSSTTIFSTLMASIPAGRVLALASDPEIAYLTLDHHGAPELDVQKVSLGLTTGFWPANITGGPFDVGVLDTGVQQNHPYLMQHRFESNGGTTDSNGHGTGMAGIMSSTHPTYTGMAFGLDTICVSLAGGDSTSMSGMNYLMNGTVEKPENVNYSFGNGTANDIDYSPFDKFMDGVCDTFKVMVSKSTGNNGWGTTTITHPAPAYNLMAMANMDDFNSLNRATHRITSSSSRGPTLGGRKKPDITAPGTNSMSTDRLGGFSNIGGTSSAAPHVGGSIPLLFQLGTTNTMACKAILLNAADAMDDKNTSSTADDVYVNGSHWNKTYGWGYLDLGEAFVNGLDVFVGKLPSPPTGQQRAHFYVGRMFQFEKATLTWNRHVAYNGSTYPTQVEDLSALDLEAYAVGTGALLTKSSSTIDNVEQLSVAADSMVVLRVVAMSPFDPQVAQETYALATEENFVPARGPLLRLSGGTKVDPLHPGPPRVRVRVRNEGDLPAHGLQLHVDGKQAGVHVKVLAPGQSIEIDCPLGRRIEALTRCYGQEWRGLLMRKS